MTFDKFMSTVLRIAQRVGVSVDFSSDPDKGTHIARCSDGTVITGNPSSIQVTVMWGSGHTAMAVI